MSDELKIPVSAPGAQQAAKDIAAVADAEKKAIDAGKASQGTSGSSNAAALQEEAAAHDRVAKSKEHNSEVTQELHVRQKSLLNELKGLGPEMAAVVEMFDTLATKTTSAGVALGMAQVAVVAMTIAYGELSKAQADQQQRAQHGIDQAKDSYEKYIGLAKTLEQSGPMKTTSDEAIKKAGEIAIKNQLPPEEVEKLAKLIARTGDESVAQKQAEALKTIKGAKSETVANEYKTEIEKIVAGTKPKASFSKILDDVAWQETDKGRFQDRKQLLDYIQRLLTRAETSLDNSKEMKEVEQLLQSYPELNKLEFHKLGKWDELGETSRYRLGGTEGHSGQTILNVVTHINHGTQYNGRQTDPAGKTEPR